MRSDGTTAIRAAFNDIGERKRMEEEISYFASFPKLNPSPILEADLAGNICYFNSAAETLLNPSTPLSSNPWANDFKLLVDAFKKSPKPIRQEIRVGESWYQQTAHYVDEIQRIRFYWVDVTERKQGEDRFRTMADAIPQLAWIARADGHIFWYNQRWYDYTGTTPEEMEGWGWQSVHDPEVLPRVLEQWRTSIDTGSPFDMAFPLRGADGRFRHFLTRVIPLKDTSGKVIQWFGTNTDITEGKCTENRLAADLAALKRMHALSTRLMEEGGLRPLLQEIVDAAVAIMGADKGTLQLIEGDCLRLVAHKGFERPFLDHFARAGIASAGMEATRRGEREVIENVETSTHFAGTPSLPVLRDAGVRAVQSTPLICRKGELLGTLNTHWGVSHVPDEHDLWRIDLLARQAADMIEHTRAGEELLKARDELELRVRERTAALRRQADLLELAHDAIMVFDVEGRITFWNSGAEEMYGWTRDEVEGAVVYRLLRTGFPVSLDDIMMTMMHAGKWEGELEHTTKDGRIITVLSRHALQRDEAGNPVAILEINLDVTEQRSVEAQFRQAHKMEAIGTLAGGIAHDFNNMLAVILGNAELAIDDVPEGDGVHHNLEAISRAAKRGRDLVKQILTFSRKNEQRQKNQPLTPLIEESVGFLRASIPSTIDIRIAINTRSDVALVNEAQFQQILVNLCTNAAHAMRASGGLLEISLESETLHLDDSSHSRPKRYLKLTVRDTGIGMDEEVRKRIFDPFFTTKGPGEGTGMGLSVVYGIVEAHDGLITVQSEPGKGSVFNVFLPKRNNSTASETLAPETAFPGGDERIMFVDDEDGIVDMGSTILERLGYEVSSFTDSEAALDTFAKAPRDFDLIITDQTMPKMTGATLAERLKAIRPDIPVMICTGYSETISAETTKARGIEGFVMKPLAKKELAEAIRKVLNQKGV